MVPILSFPTQTSASPMHTLVNPLLPQPSHTIGCKNTNTRGKKKNSWRNNHTIARVQPLFTLFEAIGHPKTLFPTIPELRNHIHLPKETPLLPTPLVGMSIDPAKESTTPHNKTLCNKFALTICSPYGHYTHQCTDLPHF